MTPAKSADDRGTTLVELIIYATVAGILLAGIAGLFVNSWVSQTQTTNRDAATGTAAAISASLARSIRNAALFEVEGDGATVRASVAVEPDQWECRAWSLTADGDLLYRRSETTIPLGSTSGWAILASGVTGTLPDGGIFGPGGADGRLLEIGFTVDAADQSVTIADGVTARAAGSEAPTCW